MLKCKEWFFIAILATIVISCSKHKEEQPKTAVPKITAPEPIIKNEPGNELYKPYNLTGAESLIDLKKMIGERKMFILYKINRLDLKHLKEGETITVPNADSNEMTYSPFPDSLVFLDSLHKILIISRQVQAFGAYENGKLIKWGPTSTGKKATPTPEGLYHTNWKSKETHSTVDEAWVLKWYFNLDSHEGISLHQYELPGYPASHSCVRLLAEDAEWIYNWAEQWQIAPDRNTIIANGTPVIVFGEYSYNKPPPWKKLIKDQHVTDLTEEILTALIKKYIWKK